MRIQHNIMAMNAYRNYNTNTSALSKNLEKLSSGYKINRAGDDAAGLAISEKMRAQITGLNAAQKNVKDGISLVKTAEGAMQEIQDMLNRMDYLATQSANGTYDNEVDRYNLQKEVNQLRSEIDRIADSANFNGIKLLNGDMSLSTPKSTTIDVAVNTVASTTGVSAAGGTVPLDSFFVTTAGNPGLHEGTGAVTQTDATFTIDISGLTITGVSGTNTLVTINVAGTAIGVAVTGGTSVNGTAIGTSLLGAYSQGGITIGGVNFKIDSATGGKIVFKATTAGTCDKHADAINAALQTEVTVTVTGGQSAGLAGNWIHGVQDITSAVDSTAGGLAGASLKLTEDVVKDGGVLTIGNQKYTFKIGANSAVTKTSTTNDTVIDLTKYEADDSDLCKQAAIALAKSATNISHATVVAGATKTTTFKISSVEDDIIHVDQTADAGKIYKEKDLRDMFSATVPQTTARNASIELSATPGAADGLNEGDLVSYTTKDADGNDVVNSFIIGTAPTGAKNADSYISATEFNNRLQNDANNSLKRAADKVLNGTGSTFGIGNYNVTVSGSNVVITAASASDADNQTKLDAIKTAIQNAAKITISKISADDVAKSGLTLQIGDTSDAFNRLKVNVGDMHVDAMGTMETKVEGGRQTAVSGKSIGDIDISTLEGAQDAIDVIKNAINYVSSIRGDLGATQNRLEHTANNLSVMAENIQDAESTIRDTDVAEEMMAYTKNNILIQSAQAMLAQANAVPQGVLQLLG